ncbi:conjugal transfer protein TrbC [Kribbella sp. NBC_00889]|uniref:conjugal transfer protein TrbC n=1 Tax=Kribbella sp. NBC_00889 TaxID=2975974 RepID=UPI00386A9664|nr:conjugal transfer protein TrbC [Kribbella sp. NBC_00889]
MSALVALQEAIGHLAPLADPPAPIPSVGSGAPPGGAKLSTILGWAAWIATGLCLLGIFIVAGTMAVAHRRGGAGEHAAGLGWVLVACVLIGSASTLVGILV